MMSREGRGASWWLWRTLAPFFLHPRVAQVLRIGPHVERDVATGDGLRVPRVGGTGDRFLGGVPLTLPVRAITFRDGPLRG